MISRQALAVEGGVKNKYFVLVSLGKINVVAINYFLLVNNIIVTLYNQNNLPYEISHVSLQLPTLPKVTSH